MFKNHPKGLPVLFFTEMWERFGYYLMLGIFFLYMTDTKMGGLGLSRSNAADIYGTYIALVYLTPFIGGLLADRILGYRKSIYIGGILMAIGYFILSFPGITALWIAIFFIIIGNGFFKPNISTLVGNIYSEPQYKDNKDAGYNIFYMGINIGAFICNFVAAYLRNHYGWGYAFAAAGVGMLVGIIWFSFGQKYVKHADVIRPTTQEDMKLSTIFSSVFLPAIITAIIGWFIPGNILGSDSNDAFIFACIPIAIYYFSLWVRAAKSEKAQIGALLSIFTVVIIFWAIFHQNGSALTIWAESYTDRQLPSSIEKVASTFGFVQKVDTTPSEVPKLENGKPVLDENGNPVLVIGTDPYFYNLPKDKWPQNNESLTLLSTEIFQSINPFFVVILTPVVVNFFSFLRRKKKEPSTPAKIGWGLFVTAISTLLMILAVLSSNNGTEKSSALWLVGTYAIITIGELFLSPMGLSLVSKISPKRITGLMMGGWFLSTSIGNKLSGLISGLWDSFDNKAYFFLINFSGALLSALAIFLMVKWLRRVVEEHSS